MSAQRKRKKSEFSISHKSKIHFKSLGEKNVAGNLKLYYECKICKQHINGQKDGNLASHLMHVHPDFYMEIKGEKTESIEVKRLKLLQNLVEIVSVNGRTFSHITDSGFLSIIQNKLQKLIEAGCGLNLSRNLPEVKQHLNEMAQNVRNKIRGEVRGRALSLLVDIVTKNHRSIFGASIQYIMNGKLKVRSIGVIELLQSHTAVYLAELVIGRLHNFGISLMHILSITTDNGANVLKMVRDVEAILLNVISNEASTITETTTIPQSTSKSNHTPVQSQTEDELTDNEINNLLNDIEECTETEALENMLDDVVLESNANLLSAITDHMTTEHGMNVLWDITGVNCSAHTLQLAVHDAIKKLPWKHSNVITLCRSIVKMLRLDSCRIEMAAQGVKYSIPRLDVATRWGSLFMMVLIYIIIFCVYCVPFFDLSRFF